MRLLSVGAWGYRRFREDRGNLDVAGKLVALVGPNEAGKTSFLRSLLHLNGNGPFSPTDLSRGGNGKVCVRSLLALDAADRALIADLDPAGVARELSLFKREAGTLTAKVVPALERDLQPREQAVVALGRLRDQKWITDRNPDLAGSLEALSTALVAASGDGLGDEVIDEVRAVASRIAERDERSATANAVMEQLEALVSHESADHPQEVASARLMEQAPQYLFFDDEYRQLQPRFSIDESPSPAMRNVFALARLPLEQLTRAIDTDDRATVTEIEVAANDQLRRVFTESWSQASISVHLKVDGREIEVLVTSAPGKFISISERSDGLRQFLALIAYVERFSSRENLVLLIDEAEMHLHYDAQADLVRTLENQTIAGKIIYSTHSAGCLPEDLGVGVRMIKATGPDDTPEEEWADSAIENWFWAEGPDTHGALSPLLIGMGATAFAFSAMRYAVVGEGVTEALLLPSLFREACETQSIGFQVAPGLAQATPETLRALDLTAVRVAYLVDTDSGGEAHVERLLAAGVDKKRIVRMGRRNQGLACEDLVRRPLYVNAVQAELWQRHALEMPASEIPEVGRAYAVGQWAKQHKTAEGKPVKISKRAVAYRLLEERDGGLLAAARRDLLVRLHNQISGLLGVP